MTTRDTVLEAIRAAGAAGVSGQALAGTLGVSRVAVGKHVGALREQGYVIDGRPGSGYVLVSAPDAPLPAEVARLLADSFWCRLTGGGPTGSTNDDARMLARSGAPEGTVVLASAQSSGRGRLGRTWSSPDGGVYLSAVLRPQVELADVPSLALAVALGVCEGLERFGVRPALKWPNDVLMGERKLAGVLLEMSAEADRVEWVVAGVGLNVRSPKRATKASEGAAYLADTAEVTLAEVAAKALIGMGSAYLRWSRGGFAAIREAYQDRLALVGKPVRVSSLDGTVQAEGTARGVDDTGRLLVEGDGGLSAVTAGEVTLRT